jgi:hypothetical protein
MSSTLIKTRIKIDGSLTDPTSVKLSDPDGTYGVKRTDNDAVVVADDTSMTKEDTGIYYHSFTDPADDLTYSFYVEFVYDGETYYIEGTISGGADQSENLYDLLPRLLPYVQDVPDLIAKQQLRHAAQDFCRKTEIWEYEFATDVTVADQADYTLSPPTNTVVLRIPDYRSDGEAAVQIDGSESTYSYSLDMENVLTLDPAPTEADLDLDVWAILLPEEDCTNLDDWLIARWGQAIVDGAVWLLKGMSDEPWSDPKGADNAERRYRTNIAAAKRERHTHRRSGGSLTARLRPFV